MKEIHKKVVKRIAQPEVLAFIMPVVILGIVYIIRGVFPFGDNMYTRMDFYHQYAPFVKEFCRRIAEGDSLLYAWEFGLGTNYWAHFAYYLASPVNFLLVLLPEAWIIETMNITMVLRAGVASVTMVYFLKEEKEKNIFMSAFGVFYALCGYYLAYSCNIIWMDGFALFPLAALGVMRIAKGKSAKLYTITMLICTFSNFYMAVIMGMCLCVWLGVCLLCEEKGSVKQGLFAIGKFAGSTILYVAMCAVVLLPVAAALMNTPAGGSEFPEKTEFYFAFYELFQRMCMNADTVLKGSDLPNIYSSVLMFVLLPVFFLNKKISGKKKLVYGAVLFFMLASFELNTLDYIWHGLHFPNSFPARQSFFYVFLALTAGYDAFEKRNEISRLVLPVNLLVMGALFALSWCFVGGDVEVTNLAIYLCSIGFVIMYSVVLFAERYIPVKLFVFSLVVLMFMESGVSTAVSGLDSVVLRDAYMEADEETQALLAEIMPGENEFYRIEEQDRKTVNDAGWDGYYGASYFSSTMPDGIREWYDAFGLRTSSVSHSYAGATPLVTSLLGVRYVFDSDGDLCPGNMFTEEDRTKEDDTMFLYENETVLPLGYMMDKEVEEAFAYNYRNPFVTQNNFASAVLGDTVVLFEPVEQLPVVDFKDFDLTAGAEGNLEESIKKDSVLVEVPAGENVFLYVTTYMESIEVEATNMDTDEVIRIEYDDLKFKRILAMGVEDYNRVLRISSTDAGVANVSFYSYRMDERVLLDIYRKLSQETMDVVSVSDTKIVGRVCTEKEGVLFLSVPYDEGWYVTVDGVKADAYAWEGAFLAVELEEGNHEIQLQYCPVGFKIGLFISVAGIFVGIFILVKRKP